MVKEWRRVGAVALGWRRTYARLVKELRRVKQVRKVGEGVAQGW